MWAALLPAVACCLLGVMKDLPLRGKASLRKKLLPFIGHGALLAALVLEVFFSLSLYSSGRSDALAAGFLICALCLSASAAVSSYCGMVRRPCPGEACRTDSG
ncbi:MAG: hypothetical protein IKD81_03335 [Eubacteriaceae bacterium]|nr:hypothetical protein [Eubacteriaceae bacterium]